MARRRRLPSRPLAGYRDIGPDVRHSKANVARSWIWLALLIGIYLLWTLIVYFFEPGLR
jgi:hypothetical protein